MARTNPAAARVELELIDAKLARLAGQTVELDRERAELRALRSLYVSHLAPLDRYRAKRRAPGRLR